MSPNQTVNFLSQMIRLIKFLFMLKIEWFSQTLALFSNFINFKLTWKSSISLILSMTNVLWVYKIFEKKCYYLGNTSPRWVENKNATVDCIYDESSWTVDGQSKQKYTEKGASIPLTAELLSHLHLE